MTDDRDQVAMSARLYPEHAEAVFSVVERDTFDKARQYFPS
jgi:hypothetical protein